MCVLMAEVIGVWQPEGMTELMAENMVELMAERWVH